MDGHSNQDRAVELLEELGLKEYEAKSFVALSRVTDGTAKIISDISEVPRTRVYDAVAELESKGLVEVQHSNPQRFRAVSIDEAVETIRGEYDQRLECLRQRGSSMEPATVDTADNVTDEVWTMAGGQAITTRTQQLIDEADREVVLVIGDDGLLTEGLVDSLQAAHERDVTIIVGAISEALRAHVEDAVPAGDVFVSGLEWLTPGNMPGDDTKIGRLLLVDRENFLVSSFTSGPEDGRQHELAVFGAGFDNGLVTIARRLMVTGALPSADNGDGGSEGTGFRIARKPKHGVFTVDQSALAAYFSCTAFSDSSWEPSETEICSANVCRTSNFFGFSTEEHRLAIAAWSRRYSIDFLTETIHHS